MGKSAVSRAAIGTAILDPYQPLAARDLQLAGRVQSDDPAVDDEGHAVAQFVGGRHVVGRQKHRAAPRFQVQDDVLDLARVHRVQPGRGFVEEEKLRVVDKRSDKGQPHLHSLGVLANSRIGVASKPDGVEQLHRIRLSPSYSEAKNRRFSRPVSF